jgi:hypothetical protein
MTPESASYRGDDQLLFGIRQAALIALAFNLLMVVAAIVSIMLTVPRGRKRGGTQ